MTNSFAAYAISVMLSNATVINKVLVAPLPEPITTNTIDAWRLAPTVWGVEGFFEMKHRFFVDLRGNRIIGFDDKQNEVEYWKRAEAARTIAKWEGETNRLSNGEALAIARRFLLGLGIDDRDKSRDVLAPTVRQEEIKVEATGRMIQYPRYNVLWSYKPAGEGGSGIRMTVYATTKSVVSFDGILFHFSPAPLPAAYYDMIGLPKNIDTNWSFSYRPPKLPVPVLEKIVGGTPRRLIVPGLTNRPAKN
jgi:hypothetical protein